MDKYDILANAEQVDGNIVTADGEDYMYLHDAWINVTSLLPHAKIVPMWQ